MVMPTNVEDMSLDLQKAILRECPINSKCHKTWLAYLDKVETKVRHSNLADNANRIMLKLYEDACSFLSELWDNEAYVIMFIRRTVLALHEQSSQGLFLLNICSLNAKRNPQAAIAISFLFNAVGQSKRAGNLITMAKKFADHTGLKQLTAAEHLLTHDGDLKSLLGVFYYEPPFQSELTRLEASWNQCGTHNLFKKPVTPRSQRSSLFSSALQARTVQGSVPSSFAASLSTSAFPASRTDFISRSRDSEFAGSTPDLRRYSTPPEAECPTPYREAEPCTRPRSSCSLLETSQQSVSMTENGSTSIRKSDFSSTISVSSDFSYPVDSKLLPAAAAVAVSAPVQLPSWDLSESRTAADQSVQPRVPLHPLNPVQVRTSIHTQSDFPKVAPIPETDENCPVPLVQVERTHAASLCISAQGETNSSQALGHRSIGLEPIVGAPECIVVNGQSYWVVNELGRGGSSVVYSVLDSKRHRWAVKCVNLSCAEKQVITSLANEISMLRSLGDTERVIRLHDCELRPDRMFLVLEHANTDLKNVFLRLMKLASTEEGVSGEPHLPQFAVLFYWDQMLRCVKVLHDRRIVHLDLKPQNFVLVDGVLKLIDLGTSQRLPDDSTRINNAVPLGTLTYMSPEQLEGPALSSTSQPSSQSGRLWSPEAAQDNHFTVGRKSDIWSLGVMLYMMVYGRVPFPQTTVQSRMLAIINPALPIEFPAIQNQTIYKALQRCLVRDFKQRASIDELLSYTYT